MGPRRRYGGAPTLKKRQRRMSLRSARASGEGTTQGRGRKFPKQARARGELDEAGERRVPERRSVDDGFVVTAVLRGRERGWESLAIAEAVGWPGDQGVRPRDEGGVGPKPKD